MKRSSWDAVCLYLEAVFDRTLTSKQREIGWQMFKGFSDDVVERASTLIAESGAERLPTWSVMFKTASGVQQHNSEVLALPDAELDTLNETEHAGVLRQLEAALTPEQRRRAQAVAQSSRPLRMITRMRLAADLLGHPEWTHLEAAAWDEALSARIRAEQAKAGELAL